MLCFGNCSIAIVMYFFPPKKQARSFSLSVFWEWWKSVGHQDKASVLYIYGLINYMTYLSQVNKISQAHYYHKPPTKYFYFDSVLLFTPDECLCQTFFVKLSLSNFSLSNFLCMLIACFKGQQAIVILVI